MDKRTALVTGASSGIGRAICIRLLEQGHRVVGVARDFSKFPRNDANFQAVSLDLADLDALPARLQSLQNNLTDLDTLDVLVCNAGAGRFGSLEEFSYQQIRALVDLNFVSAAYLARCFLPAMKSQKRGDLIFIGSEAALSGGRKGAIYAAAKFALRGLAQSLRQECAGSGVRVALVNPGMVRTAFFDELSFGPGEDDNHAILPEDVAEVVGSILTMRPGTVIDEINLSPLQKVVRFRKRDVPEQS